MIPLTNLSISECFYNLNINEYFNEWNIIDQEYFNLFRDPDSADFFKYIDYHPR